MANITEHQSYNIPHGATVVAYYCDQEVTGVVIDSRCKYGTRKQYRIQLLKPLNFPWFGSDRKAGDFVLIENTDVIDFEVI
jgi:hypothetical protein